jgi:hypothetical protein
VGRVLVITGMHRSGTSLVANFLNRSGLDVGSDLLAPDVGNPHGYFEDAKVHDFQRELLERAGVSDGFTVTDVPVPYTDADVARAREIVAPNASKAQWGWKEPRTALFLDLWHEVLPDASYLFLVRPPLAVLDSLLRRAAQNTVTSDPAVGLAVWRLHNAEMLRFSRAHPGRTQWWLTERFLEQPEKLVGTLRERFGFALNDVPLGDVLDPDAFHTDVRGRAKKAARKSKDEAKRCDALYEELVAVAA